MNSDYPAVGIDIGSIAISVVTMKPGCRDMQWEYSFHRGNIRETLLSMLHNLGIDRFERTAMTSSSPDILPGMKKIDDRVAIIKTAGHLHGAVGAILIVGGEKFGVVEFDAAGNYLNYRSNTSCAAGTGSFLDQQCRRLNIPDIADFSEIAYANSGHVPKIATRCAVFAKTDLIHAQQEGYSLPAICDGLCLGLARNIANTLFPNKKPAGPVIFTGGVANNRAVVKHLESILGTPITVHRHAALYGAMGAALFAGEEQATALFRPLPVAEAFIATGKKRQYHYPPLELERSLYPSFDSLERFEYTSVHHPDMKPVEVDIYEDLHEGGCLDTYLGIDIGSTSTKAVLMDRAKRILTGLYTRTSGNPVEAVQAILETLDHIAANKRVTFNVIRSATTGSGRKFIKELIGADTALDEISAHARAAVEMDPAVDTIIEIGGQDAKFTTLRKGIVTFSVMNNVCAAGTGSFIEEQVEKLGCSLHRYAAMTANASAPLASDRCTVFMERDINNYLNEGFSVNEILAAVLHSVRDNYLLKVAVEKNIGTKVYFQGATAKNRALVAAFEQRLGKPILVSRFCHLTGAYGAALHEHDSGLGRGSFKGIGLFRETIPVTGEVCELCANHCKLKIARVGGAEVAFGFLCGRDYGTRRFVDNNRAGFDLLKERRRLQAVAEPPGYRHDITMGIPAALHLHDDIPLWKTFFSHLGVKTVVSEGYHAAAAEGRRMEGAEFCGPMAAFHGHAVHCLERADYLFLPLYLEQKKDKNEGRKQYCYYTQFAPAVVNCLPDIDRERIIAPLVQSLAGTFYGKVQLFRSLRQALPGLRFSQVSAAYDRAVQFQENSRQALRRLFRDRFNGELSVVLLGRPYTVLSRGMNKNIPDIFAKLGVKTFFQDMLPMSRGEIAHMDEVTQVFHWVYASSMLKAAEAIARTGGLYPVLVTSFKCTPDSLAMDYFKEIMDFHDKPYLILQLDEHDSSVGYETRIEAGLRSFRNHYEAVRHGSPVKYAPRHDRVHRREPVFKGKTLLFPAWEDATCSFIAAVLRGDGNDVRLLEETADSIQRSMRHNTGQCLPLSAIAQNCIDYIGKHGLDPSTTVLWLPDSAISCNIRLFPYHTRRILNAHDPALKEVAIYGGDITFLDMSIVTAVDCYFAYMFGGMLGKLACRIRPYETVKGDTDAAVARATAILTAAFQEKGSKEDALRRALSHLSAVKRTMGKRPKVAIFGDLYVRYNNTFNQNLIRTIEENGGEVITTPYSDLMKIVVDSYIKKWLSEGYYSDVAVASVLNKLIPYLERKYVALFNEVLPEAPHRLSGPSDEALALFGVKPLMGGESLENVLKVAALTEQYDDLALFVQTNPSYCCPSLVTEAMADRIEEITGVPVVTIEYDGTSSFKNGDIIPYLHFPRPARQERQGRKAQ